MPEHEPSWPTCPICLDTEFDEIARSTVGGWRDAGTAGLDRWEIVLRYGKCRCCGHCRILNRYTADQLAFLYHEEAAIFWSTDPQAGGQAYRDMVALCQPEIGACAGPVVDFGCGHGRLLHAISEVVPADRLNGVDFRRMGDPPFRIVTRDLNQPETETGGTLPGGVGFAFATHLLEHLDDPRRFLRFIKRSLADAGYLYIEVPDCDHLDLAQAVHMDGLVCGQHIHYYTRDTLTAMLGSVGFGVVRMQSRNEGLVPRLMVVARALPRSTSEAMVAFTLDRKHWARAEVARSVLALDSPVALWGLGFDFAEMVDGNPDFAGQCENGGYGLFDLGQAGRQWRGQTIRDPSDLTDWSGAIVLLPMPVNIRHSMQAAAQSMPGVSDRLMDPYTRLVDLPSSQVSFEIGTSQATRYLRLNKADDLV